MTFFILFVVCAVAEPVTNPAKSVDTRKMDISTEKSLLAFMITFYISNGSDADRQVIRVSV
jgi:hypothetical protein